MKNLHIPFGSKSFVMGIVNVTPNSFSGDGTLDQGPIYSEKKIATLIQEGVDIIDIGGESTKPGAIPVSLDEEMDRILPVIEAAQKYSDKALISIDTMKSEVAEAALKKGAHIINDVSGMTHDPKMAAVIAKYQPYIVLMDWVKNDDIESTDIGGRYATHHSDNIVQETKNRLKTLIDNALKAGIHKDKIIIDPGIGFGKTTKQSIELIKNIDQFKDLRFPILLGASRKSVIGFTFSAPADKRLGGSMAAHLYGLMKGVDIIRVHDTEHVQAARFLDILIRNNK